MCTLCSVYFLSFNGIIKLGLSSCSCKQIMYHTSKERNVLMSSTKMRHPPAGQPAVGDTKPEHLHFGLS